MYLMQVDAFGPEDKRCVATHDKITMVQETGTIASPQNNDRDSSVGGVEEGKEESKNKQTNPVMKMFKKMSKKK